MITASPVKEQASVTFYLTLLDEPYTIEMDNESEHHQSMQNLIGKILTNLYL